MDIERIVRLERVEIKSEVFRKGVGSESGTNPRRPSDAFHPFPRMPLLRGESLERRHIAGEILFLKR